MRHELTDGAPRSSTAPLSSGVKLLRLLAAIGETTEPFRISDLARQVGASRAEVHRQVVTLHVAGWVTQLANGSYALTMRAAHLGHAAMAHTGLFDRATALIGTLAERVGEVASLAVLDDNVIRVVQRADPGRALRVTVALGARMEIWSSASGRALVAQAEPGLIAKLRQGGVRLPTPADLASIRAQGYATSIDDPDDDLLAVAVPVGADPRAATAALSVLGPRDRIDVDQAVAELKRTAIDVNNLLRMSQTFGERNALL